MNRPISAGHNLQPCGLPVQVLTPILYKVCSAYPRELKEWSFLSRPSELTDHLHNLPSSELGRNHLIMAAKLTRASTRLCWAVLSTCSQKVTNSLFQYTLRYTLVCAQSHRRKHSRPQTPQEATTSVAQPWRRPNTGNTRASTTGHLTTPTRSRAVEVPAPARRRVHLRASPCSGDGTHTRCAVAAALAHMSWQQQQQQQPRGHDS